jgi:hypothetical protein
MLGAGKHRDRDRDRPAPQKLGFIYMLAGDTGASNTDPYATKETPDNNWIQTGSHVMIVGAEAKSMMQGYPRDAKPDPASLTSCGQELRTNI